MAKLNSKAMAAQKPHKGILYKVLLATIPLAAPLALWSSLQLPFFQRIIAPVSVPQTAAQIFETCEQHRYSQEIISLDPLIIYINNFTTKDEAAKLIKHGESDFMDSFVSKQGRNQHVGGRTSQSAPLEPDIPLVSCILTRARKFMGTMLQPHEPFSVPQLVRYLPGQKYDLHTDFWLQSRLMDDGSGRRFNRVASFFIFLQDNCTEGETYFPYVNILDEDAKQQGAGGGGLESLFGGKVRRHQDGGVAFRPITGNGIFWVNLDAEGKGDKRVMHAGLPIKEGTKVGLNIWPRKFYS